MLGGGVAGGGVLCKAEARLGDCSTEEELCAKGTARSQDLLLQAEWLPGEMNRFPVIDFKMEESKQHSRCVF